MNKFIEHDIHNGLILLRCAVMNILEAINSEEIDYWRFNEFISTNLITQCMLDNGWIYKNETWYNPKDKKFTFNNSILEIKI